MARTSLAVGALVGLVATLGPLALAGCGSSGDADGDGTDSGDGGRVTNGDAASDATTGAKDGGGVTSDAAPDATTSTVGDGGTGDAGTTTRDGGSDGAAGADTGSDAGVDGGSLATVHFYGRFDTTDAPASPTAPIFDWSGSAIVADFTGTGIAVNLTNNVHYGTGVNEMQVVIDGTAAASAVVLDGSNGGTYTLASGLAKGQHRVELYKRTEALYGQVQFNGFSKEADSDTTWALVATPDAYSRRLEFVGDSITVGYGVLGADATCEDDGDYNDFYVAYGSDTARALGATAVGIGYSGKGAYRDYNGNTTASTPDDPEIPALYTRTVENFPASVYDFSTHVDAVVINLGTNDFHTGDPGAAFVTAYEGLVATVRSLRPDAYILLVDGPLVTDFSPFDGAYSLLDSYLNEVVAHFAPGDTNMGVVQVGMEVDCNANPTECGCQDHPNVSEQSTVATAVTAALKSAKGW